MSFRKFGSNLQGHPSKIHLPGIETSTGSLGQGISIEKNTHFKTLYVRALYVCGKQIGPANQLD